MKWSNLQRGSVCNWTPLPLSFSLQRVLLLTGILLNCDTSRAADRIILRSLDIVTDKSVTSFNEDGVRLDDGSSLGWHEIDRAAIGGNQSDFDTLLDELGEHLFRISERLKVGDYRDLRPHAKALYPRYKKRRSPTSYMVLQSLMWARLASGDREGALEPYLRCYAMLRARRASTRQLPGKRRLQLDPQTALTSELAPIWFHTENARNSMPGVFQAIAAMSQPRPPGAFVYYAALALAADDAKTADQALRAIDSEQPAIVELKEILAAQRQLVAGHPARAVSQLSGRWESLSAAHKPLALYWLGMSKMSGAGNGSKESGLLDLLRIPAHHGDAHPDLAAAALFQTMQALHESGDALGSVAVRNELLLRYGQTYFADRAKTRQPDHTP